MYAAPVAREGELVERWRGLLARYSEVSHHLDRALHEAHGLTKNEFETLDRLVEGAAEADYCPMQDLAACTYLSQSALSRTVARLERDGLVQRCICSTDRRTVEVRLTEAGRARHAAAHATRLAVLADHLGDQPPHDQTS